MLGVVGHFSEVCPCEWLLWLRSASACIQYLLSLRVHLAQQIGDDRLRQKLVAEVQASVEEVYGKQLPEREVLEKGYIEQVLLLRRVSRKQLIIRGVSGCLPSDSGPIDVKSGWDGGCMLVLY